MGFLIDANAKPPYTAGMKAVAVLVAGLALASVGVGQSLQQQIAKYNAATSKALKERDIKAFEKAMKPFVSPDFRYIEGGRTMTFDQMVEQMKAGLEELKTVTAARIRTTNLRIRGDQATATSTLMMAGTMPGPNGRTVTMEGGGRSLDTFRRINGRWFLTKMDVRDPVMKIDGKPIQMAAPSKTGG